VPSNLVVLAPGPKLEQTPDRHALAHSYFSVTISGGPHTELPASFDNILFHNSNLIDPHTAVGQLNLDCAIGSGACDSLPGLNGGIFLPARTGFFISSYFLLRKGAAPTYRAQSGSRTYYQKNECNQL
jgi:hypothetical protein